MDPCALATTGQSSPTITFVILGLCLIGLGALVFFCNTSRQPRRALISTLGACGLISVLAIAPLLLASPAEAATQSSRTAACAESVLPAADTTNTDQREKTPPPETDENSESSPTVQPLAPTMSAAECGIEPSVIVPEVHGVMYSTTRDGNIVTVLASPAEGFRLSAESESTWVFDVTPIDCPCAPAEVEWPSDEVSLSLNPDSGVLSASPQGWLGLLAGLDAGISVSQRSTTNVSGVWLADGVLPTEVQQAPSVYSGTVTTSGTNPSPIGPDQLLFALEVSGESAAMQIARSESAFQATYPDLGIRFQYGGQDNATTLELTATVLDNCGTPRSRTYAQSSGGGGGGPGGGGGETGG